MTLLLTSAISLVLLMAGPAEASKSYEYYQKGEKAYAQRDYTTAIAALQTYSQRNPQDYRPHYILGHCFCALGDYKQADFHYGQLLTLPGDDAVKQKGRECIAMLTKSKQGQGVRKSSSRQISASYGGLPLPPPAPASLIEDKKIGVANQANDTASTASYFAEARRKLVEEHKRSILAEAKRQADAILRAAEDEIEDIRVNHPQLVTNGQSTFFGISTHMENYIREPARAQADKIIKDAEIRVAGMPNTDPPNNLADGAPLATSPDPVGQSTNRHIIKTYTNWPGQKQNKQVAQKNNKYL